MDKGERKQESRKGRFDRSIAIIIGINDYKNGISPLKTARNDAEAIARLLQVAYQYQVLLITDNTKIKPTRNNIKQLLEQQLPKLLNSTEVIRLLFYFAGHGIALNGKDGPEGFLIPQDAQLSNAATYLPMAEVHDALLKLTCHHFLGILDCCFAGAFRWSSTRTITLAEEETIYKERFDRFIQDSAWQVITSASYDQTALDIFKFKDDRGQLGSHSPFAAALIEALKGKADTYPPAIANRPAGDGVITATELYLYLRDRVEIPTETHAKRQTPGIHQLKHHDKGEYIFLVPGHELNLPPAPPLDVSKNPYRGLEPFQEEHQDLFFGRDELAEKLYEAVVLNQFTVVLGASGSGKSSLVKAGLLPQIRQNKQGGKPWFILPPFRPGESPFRSLNNVLESVGLPPVASHDSKSRRTSASESLASWFREHPAAKLLLVVDQFEELITLCSSEEERQDFSEALKNAITTYPNQLHLVITLRSDFEPQFRNSEQNKELEPYWKKARFIVPAMTREELQQAIEKPAAARVMYFDPPKLVEHLINEVANMPGALPLLSFTLSELYLKYLRRQENAKLRGETIDRAITQADYEELGGVTRSLTQRAEQEYSALCIDPAYEVTIRNVMLRMVSVGGELARRRVFLSELGYPEPENERVQIVIKRFERARLLTSGTDSDGKPYKEPAHDVLIRGWERLLAWRQQYLSTLILQRDLTADANQWENSDHRKQSAGLLWIEDPRLPEVLHLLSGKDYKDTWLNLFYWRLSYKTWQPQSYDYWLNLSELNFVLQSFNEKFKRFRNATITTAVIILTSLTGLTGYVQQTKISQIREQTSRVLHLLTTTNRVPGLILAIDTMEQSQSIPFVRVVAPSLEMAAQSSLLSAVQVSQEINRMQGHEGLVLAVAFSPDGSRIASSGYDKTIRVWDAKTGQLIGQPLKGHQGAVGSVAFSPDNNRIVSGSFDETIRLWDIETGQQIGEPLIGHQGFVNAVAFSPDGNHIVSGGDDQTLRLWNAQTRELIQSLKVHEKQVRSVAFSPNGMRIVSGSEDKTIRLWDVQTGQPIGQPLVGHEDSVISVAFSPDGTRIVSGSHDNTIRLWDAQTGEPIKQPLVGHENWVKSVAFSADGTRIASGSYDNTIRLWDAETLQLIGEPLIGHESGINSVRFSPDNTRIISGSNDRTVRLWDAQSGQPIIHSLRFEREITSVAFGSVQGDRQIAAASYGNMLQLWDVQTGQSIGTFSLSNDIATSIAFSPDGARLATGSYTGVMHLWNVQTRQPIGNFVPNHSRATIRSVAFSPDGQFVISGGDDKRLQLWDGQTGKAVGVPWGSHDYSVTSVAFSPDGKYIVSGSQDAKARFWDVQTKQLIGQSLNHDAWVASVAFSPDGRRIVSGSGDSTVRMWDVRTRRQIGQPLRGHEGSVTSVAFSSDGRRIVSGSDDGTIRLWDAWTGQPMALPSFW